jgi:MFS family permease
MTAADFVAWGWRIPFLVSLILLVWSLYIRLRLNESPVFQRMKDEGRGSDQPLTDSFLRYPNNRFVALALFGACMGQGVVWYTGQFYALFFLTTTLHLNYVSAYVLLALTLLVGTPFFIVFGALSDRIGRLKIILAGCVLGALTYFPLFSGLSSAINPDLVAFNANTKITVAADDCSLHVFVGPWSTFSACDRTRGLLTSLGLSFDAQPAEPGKDVVTTIGDTRIEGFDAAKINTALAAKGYKPSPDPAKINWAMAFILLLIMVIYVTMVYGPIAAFLVEMFPTRIRYTSMSFPYHIGNGWFGGLLPLVATALVAWRGDIYFGLWYPVIFAALTVVVGALFLRDNRDVNFHD